MRKILLIVILFISLLIGCDKQNSDGTYTPHFNIKTYVIDSCEYCGILDLGDHNFFAHKGNCKYCAERFKDALKEIILELKEE